LNKKILLIALLFLMVLPVRRALGQQDVESISKVKLHENALPKNARIVKEVWGSADQLNRLRLRLGIPVTALLNQVVTTENEQAQVNYVLTMNAAWLAEGYSNLVEIDGNRSCISVIDSVLLQIATPSKELEREILQSLHPDPVFLLKLKFNSLPQNWGLKQEWIFLENELAGLQNSLSASTLIEAALSQDFLAGHSKLVAFYFRCKNPGAASQLAQILASQKRVLNQMTIGRSGSLVVTIESQNVELNKKAISLVNWPAENGVQIFSVR